MAPVTNLREQLYRDEGVRLKPYKDSVGKLTIGVGRNLDDVGVSIAESDLMLDNDISRASAAVYAQIPWADKLDEVRRAVLTNMCFNLGITGLLGFKRFLAECEKGAWVDAAAEMLDSKWRKQVGMRATRLAEQLVTGEWR